MKLIDLMEQRAREWEQPLHRWYSEAEPNEGESSYEFSLRCG